MVGLQLYYRHNREGKNNSFQGLIRSFEHKYLKFGYNTKMPNFYKMHIICFFLLTQGYTWPQRQRMCLKTEKVQRGKQLRVHV